MRGSLRSVVAGAIACLASAVTLSGSEIPLLTLDQLVDGAREIFVGRVVAKESRFVDLEGGKGIVTLVTFRIEDGIKDAASVDTMIEFLGGKVGDVELTVSNMPQFEIGDRDLLFIGSRLAVSPIVGFAAGRFRIVKDASGIDRLRTYNGDPLTTQSRSLGVRTLLRADGPVAPLALRDFRDAIVDRLRTKGRY